MGARDRGPDEEPTPAVAQLLALATALKQSTIYPAGHPRVRQGVAEFLQPLARDGHDCILALRANTFRIGGAHVAVEHASTRWLADRLREAGLRGIEITSACTVDDVLELALLFREARRGRARDWPAEHPRLRALPMVFDGTHDEDTPPTAAQVQEPQPFASLPPRVGAALAHIRTSETFQLRMRDIQRAALAAGALGQRDVDLLETIGALIPERVAEQPERVTELVERVLDAFADEITRLSPRSEAMKGTQLLQRVVAVARRYFPANVADEAPALPPAGRPEDASIDADVGALMRELSALMPDARSTSREVGAATGRALAHELLGVHLHAFATSRGPLAVAAPLIELLRKHAAERPLLLDSYLAVDGGNRSLAPERRVLLLSMLVETGHAALVHSRGYVDEALLVRDFPEGLPLAARLLGTDTHGLALLRRALATLAPTLALDGIPAAVALGVLRDPLVLRALLAAGGDEARELVLAAADAEPRLARTAMLVHLRARVLPELATLVLRTHRSDDALTPQYVRSLWLACDHRRADPAVDSASAELLVRALASGTPMTHAERIAALPYLHLATRGPVADLLRQFASAGRFTRWSAEARELRTQARRALALLRTTRSR